MGSGFKTFTAGSVLTASDVQNYLQDQAVMVFAGTAARSSAIGTANFEEGMLTYLTDVDKLQVYTGATFADVYPPAASNQGLTLLNTTSFSGVATQSINDCFSTTYDYYRILLEGKCASTSAFALNVRLRVSGADNSSSNYRWSGYYVRDNSATPTVTGESSNGTTTSFQIGGLSSTAGYSSIQVIDIANPFVSTKNTGINAGYFYYDQSGPLGYNGVMSGSMSVTTSYTGFTLICGSNMTGSVSVYGYNK